MQSTFSVIDNISPTGNFIMPVFHVKIALADWCDFLKWGHLVFVSSWELGELVDQTDIFTDNV